MTFSMRLVAFTGLVSASFATVVHAGNNYEAGPTIADNGATAGVVLLLAIGAIVMLKGAAGGSASEKRKDKAADEE